MQSPDDPLKAAVVDKVLGLGQSESIKQGFLDLYRAMANEANIDGAPAKTVVLPLYDASCALEPGDWAPEIHLVIRKVESVEQETGETEGSVQAVRGPDTDAEGSAEGHD